MNIPTPDPRCTIESDTARIQSLSQEMITTIRKINYSMRRVCPSCGINHMECGLLRSLDQLIESLIREISAEWKIDQ